MILPPQVHGHRNVPLFLHGLDIVFGGVVWFQTVLGASTFFVHLRWFRK